jgi:hypothetical protein
MGAGSGVRLGRGADGCTRVWNNIPYPGYGIALGAFCIENAPNLVATRFCPVATGAHSDCNLFTSGCNLSTSGCN